MEHLELKNKPPIMGPGASGRKRPIPVIQLNRQ